MTCNPQPFASGACRLAVLAVALLATGCEHAERAQRPHHAASGQATDVARNVRETEMNARWQNHPFSELLGTLGPPRMVLAIPGGGNPPSFAVVYGVDPKTGCVDAFAVHIDAQPFVRVYHCR